MPTRPTTAPARRGPYGKTRGRVETIGRIAYDLVVEVGHRAVTRAEVARRAGLTEAQVLYHLPTREHLLVAALEHADARSRELSRTPTTLPTTDDPEAALAASVTAGLADAQVLRLFVSMSAEASDPAHPVHDWVRRHRAGAAAAYAGMLRDLQASGWAHPAVDPDEFALQLMALWEGLQGVWLADPSFDLGAAVARGVRTLSLHDAVPVGLPDAGRPDAPVRAPDRA